EVRFPFASTIDPTYMSEEGFVDRSTEFGNLSVILKALVYSEGSTHVAAGIGVGIPTAQDVRVHNVDNAELIHIKNDVVHLIPYLAVLCTPDDRFYAQAFGQVDVGLGSYPVSINPDLTGLQPAGRLRDTTYMALDFSTGYWLIRDERAPLLTGLA